MKTIKPYIANDLTLADKIFINYKGIIFYHIPAIGWFCRKSLSK